MGQAQIPFLSDDYRFKRKFKFTLEQHKARNIHLPYTTLSLSLSLSLTNSQEQLLMHTEREVHGSRIKILNTQSTHKVYTT